MNGRLGRATILALIIGLAVANPLALRVPASSAGEEDTQFLAAQAEDLTLGDGSSSGGPQMSPHTTAVEVVYFDYVDDEGRLSGGRALSTVPLTPSSTAYIELAGVSVASLFVNGPSTNRIDVVFLGDGYTASELGVYADHVNALVGFLFTAEPFSTYQGTFNAYRVDVVSNESGIDHDPTFGIYRDTALDAGRWCNGVERHICVDIGKTLAYAAVAPDADLIVVVLNSTTYGGSAYVGLGIATVTGGHVSSPEVLVHEMGHALGGLADEYDYGDGAVYTGSEPLWPNVSLLDADQMAISGIKWARWLGTNDPLYGGLVSAYEGAFYHEFGVYRPTADSIMNSVASPSFNLPSMEALVVALYQTVSPVDGSSPLATDYVGNEQLFVDPLPGIGSLSIQWFLEGAPIPGATGPLLDLATISAPPGEYTVSVTVADDTSFVRDQAARQISMTEELQFKIRSALFSDTRGSVFEADITWLARAGITKGCNPPTNDMFCPGDPVTRGQMAAFLVRAMNYTDDGGGNLFTDDDDSGFEHYIDRLATAGVTWGCSLSDPGLFCPGDPVTRGQMAAFLVRAMNYTDDGGGNLFTDDDDSGFEHYIDRLATAGVTWGCSLSDPGLFCPNDLVKREQMAAFLHRALL